MNRRWQTKTASSAWRVLAAVGVLSGALAFVGVPAIKAALEPAEAVLLELDICTMAPPTPFDPASGLALTAARAIPADARCPVCGMFPARSPNWAAQVIFSNGDAQFFDSPVNLFMYLNDLPYYSPGRSASDVVAAYVTDASSRDWIDARSAFYVHGSSALGPMRAGNLPAFVSKEAAQSFVARRGGVVLAFDAIDAELVTELGGAHSHHAH